VSQALKSYFFLAIAGCLPLAQPLMAAGIKGNLVGVQWLEKNLNSADVVILDASSAQNYAANHIPGAVNVDLFTYGLPDTALSDMEKRIQSWGVSPGKTIVMYDQGGSMMATRIQFSLLYYGYPAENLLILDGGLTKWRQAGLPVTKEATAAKAGSFKIKKVDDDVKANLPEVVAASGDPANNALVEALGTDWHFGQTAPFDRGGHIPNGILLSADDFYNPDKTFKSAEEIGKMVAYLGIKPEQQIYTYCGGGVAASVPFFALKFVLHYPNVKLFQGSELEWLSDERGLPYWTYDAPSLMRQTNWMQFWAGQMPRMIGLAHVSIVDVRPPDEFSQGHLPLALNIPADVFRDNLGKLEKLAKILGPAGVSACDEAVVISGAGLTKESALVFLALEKLGQKKVSVFMDSMDKWVQLGHQVTKAPTVVSAEKAEGAAACPCQLDQPHPTSMQARLTIPATTYPTNFRKDVIIADAKSTEGVYPKVFIASGKDVPAKAPDGKVVHVPYTELLNADGTPKAAKDIWTILTKAGVPRYAELVCYSDEPGEAAVNYFILKLMGYPDIKVLVI